MIRVALLASGTDAFGTPVKAPAKVAFWWSIGFTGLAVLPALLLPRQRG